MRQKIHEAEGFRVTNAWFPPSPALPDHFHERAGFADQSHFTRAFRRQFGVPLGRYRQLARA